MKSPALSAMPLLSALAWTAALIVDPGPFTAASVLLMGLGLIAIATVSMAGMVVSGSRWAHRLAMANVAAAVLVAASRPIDPIWLVALTATGLALVSLFLPGVTDGIRKLPSATGPPPRAVATPLLLLSAPFLIGLAAINGEPWAMITVGLSAPAVALAYARVLPGGLLAVRVLWPTVALGLAPFLGLIGGLTSAALGVVVAVLAWHPTVKVAFHPPIESGTTYSIPPELTPREILDAAEIDDTGRSK